MMLDIKLFAVISNVNKQYEC